MHQKDVGKHSQERELHPSIYERIRKTKALIKENADPEKFWAQGGLDLDTFKALQQRWRDQEEGIKREKQQLIDKYGSLKVVPSIIGPCKKIAPVIGTKNALVLLIEFKDIKHNPIYGSDYLKDFLFGKGKHSMRDYFLEASWNQLDIKGNVSDEWYTTVLSRSEYLDKYPVEDHYPNAQKLVKEAILQAKNSKKFDFSNYAKDGKIEILIVVYAGYGLDTKLNINYIRPHKDTLLEPIEVQNGVWAREYCIIPELPSDDLGCFCHEVGHFLGLPDLYKEGYSPVVGSWCLMGIGNQINYGRTPSHPSAWCKVHLGWTEPKLLNQEPQNYEIPAVIDDKNIYIINIEGTNRKEYFLIENRQQKGFDEYLPGSGMLIWHVDESACVVQAPNNDPQHFFLTLKQSDGKEDLQRDRTELFKKEILMELPKDVEGDLGDPFPGITVNRTFDDESNPNSRSYTGNKSFVNVVSISDSKDLMNAEMGIKPITNETTTQSIPTAVESKKKTSIKLTPPKFMTFIPFQKPKDPYEEGWEAFFDDLKEKIGLKEFQDGYRLGYRLGYVKAIKKIKK